MKRFISLLLAFLLVLPVGVLAAESDWISEEPALEPYAYSFAVVGDTQIVIRDFTQYYAGIYEWILDNAEEKNTKMIIGLGDITDDNEEREWALADAVFERVSGVLPHSFVRGNHDGVENYDKYLSYAKYGNHVSGSMEESMRNTYIKIDVGNIKYLILNLDIDGDDENLITWANKVCEENPDRNIIVTTHGYIDAEGELIPYYSRIENGYYWSEDGERLWNDFIKYHENIVMVLCGHVYTNSIVVSEQTGVHGNVVKQIVVNPQTIDTDVDGAGLVAMFYFSEDGKNVQLRYYSTIKNAYYKAENQFSFNLETKAGGTASNEAKIEAAEVDYKAPAEENVTLDLNEGSCSFTADQNTKIKDGTISLDVTATGMAQGGKIVAGCYDKAGRLVSVKTYDLADVVNVTFDNFKAGMTVKVRWWEGRDTIIPIGNGVRKEA